MLFRSLVGRSLPWRTAYLIGAGLGFGLLALRVRMFESGMFDRVQASEVKRGDVTMLLRPPARLFKYLRCILIGIPIWYVVGILVGAAPELARALGAPAAAAITPGDAVLFTYVGLVAGDLASGFLSQAIGSRRRVVAGFLALTAAAVGYYLTQSAPSRSEIGRAHV